MKISKIYRAAVAAKKHLLYLPLMALILCVAGCSDTISQKAPTNYAKTPRLTRSNNPSGVSITIDTDLNNDYMYSTYEAKELLSDALDDMYMEHPDVAGASVIGIPSANIVGDFATYINSIDWTNHPYEDSINAVIALESFVVPSTFCYIINFPNDSGCAIVSADKRIPSPMAFYCNKGRLYSEDLDMHTELEYIYSYITESSNSGEPNAPTNQISQLIPWNNVKLWEDSHARLTTYSQIWLEFMLSLAPCQYNQLDYPCPPASSYATAPANNLKRRIVNYNAWDDVYPYVSSIVEEANTNIPLAIMKILTHEGFVGTLFNQSFDGSDFRTIDHEDEIAEWTDLIYQYISSDTTMTYSDKGLQFLSDVCGYYLTNPDIPKLPNTPIEYWYPYVHLMTYYHVGIIPRDANNWDLVVGMTAQESNCLVLSYSVNFLIEDKAYDEGYRNSSVHRFMNPVIFYLF